MDKLNYKIFNEEDLPEYELSHIMEAFDDILSAICKNNPVFSNIAFGTTSDGAPALRYTVNATNKECLKLFKADQGLPELKADLITWLFSLLDGAVNIF